ncbi:MAG: DNA polymerase III subunit delta [Candidatus Margulisiibacteriota bacterium]
MNKALYLLWGEEDFLIEEKIKELKSKVKNPSLNIEILDQTNLEKLPLVLQTFPMFGEEKLVILKEIDLGSEIQNQIIPLVKNIPPGIKLVIYASSVDKRSKLYKLISEIGQAIEFKTFAPWETEKVVAWIKLYAKRAEKTITNEAAMMLQQICGNNLRLLASEIEKNIIYVGARETIEVEDIKGTASFGEKSVFDLLDALRAKDLNKSLVIFYHLFKNKEDLFQLLATIAAQYRLMLQIKSLEVRSHDYRKIAMEVGSSPYFVKKCLEHIHQFSQEELIKNLEALLQANLKMKTGEAQQIVFEMLLTELCGK